MKFAILTTVIMSMTVAGTAWSSADGGSATSISSGIELTATDAGAQDPQAARIQSLIMGHTWRWEISTGYEDFAFNTDLTFQMASGPCQNGVDPGTGNPVVTCYTTTTESGTWSVAPFPGEAGVYGIVFTEAAPVGSHIHPINYDFNTGTLVIDVYPYHAL